MSEESKNPNFELSKRFGSFDFTHEMELCFVESTKCLERVLDSKIQQIPQPVGMLLASAHQSAEGASTVIAEGLVNESYLMMRMMMDASASALLLLDSDESLRKEYANTLPKLPKLKPGEPEDLVKQAQERLNFDGIPSNPLGSISERIERIKNLKIKRQMWAVAIASICPVSGEFISGSLQGHAYGLMSKGAKTAGRDEFSMLLLMGSSVINETIEIFCNFLHLTEVSECIETINARVSALAQPTDPGLQDLALGAWNRLRRIEGFGHRRITADLMAFEKAFELTYEAGLIVLTLKANNQKRFNLAALYFRRALNDFRSVWLLLSSGYTSQAALSAGSLFESCLGATCLLYSENIKKYEACLSKSGEATELPWKPIKMAKLVCGKRRPKNDTINGYENAWRALYARYVWLSQIRHSSFQSVIHDISAAKTEKGEYVVTAFPNLSSADLPVKSGVLFGALADLQSAISAFLDALGYEEATGEEHFDSRYKSAREALRLLMHNHASVGNPISLEKTWFAKKYPPIKED